MINIKNLFNSISGIFLILIAAVGYFNNIIWLFDNWNYIEWFSKAFHIFSILIFPPLGSIAGIIHFF